MGDPISLVLDCADPMRVGAFWRQALGYVAKNRLHIDIRRSEGAPRPSEEERRRIDAAVGPLVELGATVLRRNQDPDDWFVVLQDPEGNEFCLV